MLQKPLPNAIDFDILLTQRKECITMQEPWVDEHSRYGTVDQAHSDYCLEQSPLLEFILIIERRTWSSSSNK